MNRYIRKASTLIEAIPYIHAFRRKVFVVKYGGSILHDNRIRRGILEDLVFLSFVGIRTILVHGGGPHISARLTAEGIDPVFHEGIRVTDKKTLEIVLEELSHINQQIVGEIRDLKGDVTGLRGQDNLIHVEKKKAARDLGYVGTIKAVERKRLERHLKRGYITVVSPMGVSTSRELHNVNADEVASAIAISLQAEKLVLLTNVQGVLRQPNSPETLISTMTAADIQKAIQKKVIQGGMIPKVMSCLEALKGGVKKAHIIDARIRHALLLEIFTDQGIGTQIIHGSSKQSDGLETAGRNA